jgi:(p)ppGpp synthase/HD superfamily hydrolase
MRDKLVDYKSATLELARIVAETELPEDKYEHTKRVVRYTYDIALRECCLQDEEILCLVLAYLHDVIEDGGERAEEYIKEYFGDMVLECVLLLTHRKDEETYPEYIDRVLAGPRAVQVVKRADMKDHLCQKETLTPKLKEKYLGVLDKFM